MKLKLVFFGLLSLFSLTASTDEYSLGDKPGYKPNSFGSDHNDWYFFKCLKTAPDGQTQVVPYAVARDFNNEDHCPPLSDYSEVINEYQANGLSLTAQNANSNLGDFVRNEHNQIRTDLNLEKAVGECESKNLRVPTARELALDAAKKYGLVVISVADVLAKKLPAGFSASDFKRIYIVESNGDPDSFLYSNKLYKKPNDDSGDTTVWATSRWYTNNKVAWEFNYKEGEFYLYYPWRSDNSVRCVGF
jgi:hypothetical protein